MKKIILLILLLITINLSASRYAGDFLIIGTGVRAAGMGGAFSAIANDGSAVYWNASGLSQIKKTEASLMRAYLYKNLAVYDNFTFCQPLPGDVTIGLNWTRLSIDDIPIFSEEWLVYSVDYRTSHHEFNLPGTPDGQMKSTDDVIQFAFAKHIHKDINLGWLFFEVPLDLHFGITIKYINRNIAENTANGTGFDFSVMAKTDLALLFEKNWLGKIKFSTNFQDVGGTDITWIVEDDFSNRTDEILFNTKVGVAIIQPLKFIDSSITISSDTDYIYGKSQHFGMEYYYKNILGLRTGYYNEHISAGLSLKFYNFTIDYAFVTNSLANTNRIGLTLIF